MNRAEYRAQFYSDFNESEDSGFFSSSSLLNSLIEIGREKVWNALVKIKGSGYGEKTGDDIPITSSSSSYDLPDDFIRMIEVRRVDLNPSLLVEYNERIKTLIDNDLWVDIEAWALQDNKIIIRKPVTATIRPIYIRTVTRFSGDAADSTDDPDIPLRFQPVVGYFVMWRACMKEGSTSADFWKKLFEDGIDDITMEGNRSGYEKSLSG